MSKHTPGPWSIGKNGRIEAKNGLGKTVVVDELAIGDPANAALIAAAPELLDALKLCSAELFAQCAEKKRAMWYVEQARAIIAKSER